MSKFSDAKFLTGMVRVVAKDGQVWIVPPDKAAHYAALDGFGVPPYVAPFADDDAAAADRDVKMRAGKK